jgi:hypothetical protein
MRLFSICLLEEAISLLGIIESLIGAIYRDMISRQESGQPLVAIMESSSVVPLLQKGAAKGNA